MVVLATAVLCGASLFSGALLAGIFAVFVPEALRRLGLPLDVGNALLALGAFDVLRRGTGGIAQQIAAKRQERLFRGTRVTCALAPLPTGPAPSAGERPSEPCLEIRGLTVAYGRQRVLHAVDLTVGRGEVHALIGPNGAGKTTLIDAASGFLRTATGAVRLDGEQIDRCTARERARSGLRRTFQQLRSVEAMTVAQYLRLASADGDAAAIARAHEFWGLPDGRVPIRLLDSGSRRVLEIAGALAARPKALLIDEPAAGLGEAERQGLAERVRRIPAEFGCAVLLIEHDMEFVRAASGRATVLDEGRVLASGAVDAVLADPRVIEIGRAHV
jgi:branched-chain amino acid transport system permease protein